MTKSIITVGNDKVHISQMQMSQLVNTNVTIGRKRCHNMKDTTFQVEH